MFEALLIAACALAIPVAVVGWWYSSLPVVALRERLTVTPLSWRPEERLEVGLGSASHFGVDELPGYALLLLLLHEDDLFFVHNGVNAREVWNRMRAFMSGRSPLHGGSSITQQLAKHLFSPHRRAGRLNRFREKARETVYALKLESHFSKQEIASLYISSIRCGVGEVFGFKTACELYFQKLPRNLELHEALFLIGIIPAPSTFVWNVVCERRVEAFPLKTAFVKCVDLLRLIVLSFGWRTLDLIHTLSFRDVLAVALDMRDYNPGRLQAEFELVLEARAMIIIHQLHAMLQRFAERPHAELVSFVHQAKAAHG